MEFLTYYGNATADTYQFDGLEGGLLADATAKTALSAGGSFYDGGNAAATLSTLDTMIDKALSYNGSSQDKFVFLASRPMISRVSALQTRVTRVVNTVRSEMGFEMETYRTIPLLPTGILTPLSTSTSPTLTGAAAAGGALAAGTYYFAISSVTLNGEQKASAAASVVTASSNLTAHLTWTADSNAKLYKIWRGTTSTVADMGLIAVIPALTYDGNGNLSSTVASYDDTGVTPNTALNPLVSTDEQIALVNITAGDRGVRYVGGVSPLGEKMDSYFSYVPLSTTNGSYRFMMEGFIALRNAYPECNVIARNVRAA